MRIAPSPLFHMAKSLPNLRNNSVRISSASAISGKPYAAMWLSAKTANIATLVEYEEFAPAIKG
jgi:hypothetical protein